MAGNGPPYTPSNIYAEQLNLKPMVIAKSPGQYGGPHLFWVNPQQYSDEVTRLIVNQPTQNGIVRFNFGYSPTQYVISGWTGNGGQTELLDSTIGMGYFQPNFGVQDQVYYLTFPYFRLMDVPVYIDYMKRSADSTAMPYYASYEIHLSQIGATAAQMQAFTGVAGNASAGVNGIVASGPTPTPPSLTSESGGS